MHRYWHHDLTPDGVARDFGPGTRGEEAGEDLLVSVAGQPVALVQRSRIADTWSSYPECPAIIVPVVAGNIASWRALEKAGFRRVGEGDMQPDNPIDLPLHVISRIDRPGLLASVRRWR